MQISHCRRGDLLPAPSPQRSAARTTPALHRGDADRACQVATSAARRPVHPLAVRADAAQAAGQPLVGAGAPDATAAGLPGHRASSCWPMTPMAPPSGPPCSITSPPACRARSAIAETGTLVLWTETAGPRLLSLVPPVAPRAAGCGSAARRPAYGVAAEGWAQSMPTNALLVSGPSRRPTSAGAGLRRPWPARG